MQLLIIAKITVIVWSKQIISEADWHVFDAPVFVYSHAFLFPTERKHFPFCYTMY